jgi:hypothetical protein
MYICFSLSRSMFQKVMGIVFVKNHHQYSRCHILNLLILFLLKTVCCLVSHCVSWSLIICSSFLSFFLCFYTLVLTIIHCLVISCSAICPYSFSYLTFFPLFHIVLFLLSLFHVFSLLSLILCNNSFVFLLTICKMFASCIIFLFTSYLLDLIMARVVIKDGHGGKYVLYGCDGRTDGRVLSDGHVLLDGLGRHIFWIFFENTQIFIEYARIC